MKTQHLKISHLVLASLLTIGIISITTACNQKITETVAKPSQTSTPPSPQPTNPLITTVESTSTLPPVTITNTPYPQRTVSVEELMPLISWLFPVSGYLCPIADEPTVQTFRFNGIEKKPSTNLQIGEVLFVSGCGFPANANGLLTFVLPNGQKKELLLSINENGIWSDGIWLLPEYPTGNYTLKITSGSVIISKTITVTETKQPLLISACLQNQSDSRILLAGFQPEEIVLLASYIYDASSSGYLLNETQYLTMNDAGWKIQQLSMDFHVLIALGSLTPRRTQVRYIFSDDDNMMLISAVAIRSKWPLPCLK